jgi:hypothetical protein
MGASMNPSDLRVALFSGNYNYVRDGANQALNKLVRHLLDAGVQVRVYSPTTDTPAFEPQGDLVSVPAFAMPGGRGEYKVAFGLQRRRAPTSKPSGPTSSMSRRPSSSAMPRSPGRATTGFPMSHRSTPGSKPTRAITISASSNPG